MAINWEKMNKLETHQINELCDKLGATLIEQSQGNFPDWDAKMEHDGKKFTVEIKTEMGADETGNIVIEVFNTKQRKPSGINGTKATHWCNTFYDHTRKTWATFFCKTKMLKQWLEAEVENETVYNAKNWRSDNNAAIVLVPWTRLKHFVNNPLYCVTWDHEDPKQWLK